MRRKINFEFVLMILIAIVIFIIGASLIARNSLNNLTELNLNHYQDMLEIEANQNSDYQSIIDKYESLNQYLRISFIDENGVVLADSLATNLDNHINRPEIQNIGEVSIRYSDTLKIDMMYLANQLDNGDYLRLAIPSASILQFLNDFIGLAIVVGIIIIVLSIMLTSVLIKQSLKPLKDILLILEDINEGQYREILPLEKYDEINGFIQEINKISASISNNISSLKSEKSKTDFLLEHMNQGLCVLNKQKQIILLNHHLKELYNFNINLNMHKDYRFLFRDELVQKAIEKAFENKEDSQIITQIKDAFYNVSISYRKTHWTNESSVIIIYNDVSNMKEIEILKRDFFVNASHELKSPLTSIIGSADLILQDMIKDEATQKDLIERIHNEAVRMNLLVMDMLMLSEVENKLTQDKMSTIDLDKLVDDVLTNLSYDIDKQNIEIHRNIQVKTYQMNEEDLFQLIKNLVENAVKYNKDNGHVWIDIFEENDYINILIKDDGIGIAKEEQTRIFERFYRVDKARSKMIGGTGLGLSIVKHILINYHGHYQIKSQVSQGTSINIQLPLIKK
ncbi:hypothetical protein HF295_02255 [Hujiaoplasma nucleasis]|uniref:histidine kinase n=1 Tax=Hujiaoplasma nucleasis TaxID=2725268 RepID=A0A7L6N0H6_9MOLU|nr:ATP-binding protein [Hujiaoplasma nucleasis]QLY39743.1 hypothetical protein HF295_02255 [Hujiaoplasma nucleasis]